MGSNNIRWFKISNWDYKLYNLKGMLPNVIKYKLFWGINFNNFIEFSMKDTTIPQIFALNAINHETHNCYSLAPSSRLTTHEKKIEQIAKKLQK